MAAKTPTNTKEPQSQGSYTVLARRYRSRDFDELIGQEPIARTLQNAIKTNRVAHAYLFSGTRGVGKTSLARILAKALNATQDLKERDDVAEAILRGDDLDVIEIDGASYRGINEARELIAGASLSPARSPYKIYIIDEVHQLTRDAFNALLKTMEEPPSHVKFILCTTEPNKVPATIQSRCQRFDFRPIPTPKIADQLRSILKSEGINADDEVIMQVARLGNGSMRDALSLMDRLLAAHDEKLTIEVLEQTLGLPDHTLVHNLVQSVIDADSSQALKSGQALINQGTSVDEALDMLAEHFRSMMLISACGDDNELLDLSDENRQLVASHASHFDTQSLVHMIALCDSAARNARGSAASRAFFDAVLVRLCMSEHFADIPAILKGGLPTNRPAAPSQTVEPKKKEVEVVSLPSPATDLFGRKPGIPRDRVDTVTEVKPPTEISGDVSAEQLWKVVCETASTSLNDRMRVDHLNLESFDGRTLCVSVDESGADIAKFLTASTDWLVNLVKRATGRRIRIELDTSRVENNVNSDPKSDEISAASNDPTVAKAMELFDAELVSATDLSKQAKESDNV